MILFSRQNLLKFLPALPDELSSGKVKGLKAKGGFEVDIEWAAKKLELVRIKSLDGRLCSIKNDKDFVNLKIVCDGNVIPYQVIKDKGIINFKTIKSKEYKLTFQS